MSTAIAESAAFYHSLGLPCPWDCNYCEMRQLRHLHSAACGHVVTCYDDDCFTLPLGPTPVVACLACAPQPTVTCTRDPWLF